MGVVAETGLTSRGVIGRFYRRLEEHARNSWWTRLAMHFVSDQGAETYRWLGSVPQVREWVGGRRIRPLRSSGMTIENKVWESTIRVDADELRRDKTGQLLVRVNELARRVAQHPAALISTLIDAGETGAAYDGTTFYSATHSEGDSGTQSNIVSADVQSATAPTVEETYAAVMEAVSRLLAFKDDAGEPINEDAREFVLFTPPSLLSPVLSAVRGKLLESSTNPIAIGDPIHMQVIANPRLTWNSRLAIFRADSETRPFIFQEEMPVQVQVLAEGSELEANENQHQYGVKAVHAAGYGFWQSTCLVVFS